MYDILYLMAVNFMASMLRLVTVVKSPPALIQLSFGMRNTKWPFAAIEVLVPESV